MTSESGLSGSSPPKGHKYRSILSLRQTSNLELFDLAVKVRQCLLGNPGSSRSLILWCLHEECLSFCHQKTKLEALFNIGGGSGNADC